MTPLKLALFVQRESPNCEEIAQVSTSPYFVAVGCGADVILGLVNRAILRAEKLYSLFIWHDLTVTAILCYCLLRSLGKMFTIWRGFREQS